MADGIESPGIRSHLPSCIFHESSQGRTNLPGSLLTSGFLCPSDPNINVIYVDDEVHPANTSDGKNRGDWYVWGVRASSVPPQSPFRTNISVALAAVKDGLGQTLMAAEVKTGFPHLRKCTGLAFQSVNATPRPETPSNPAAVARYTSCSGEMMPVAGHAEWEDGNVNQSGFTTAWTTKQEDPGRLRRRPV